MSTPNSSSRQAARFALRLDRRTHNHHLTSYRENGRASSSPASETEVSVDGCRLSENSQLTTDNRQPSTFPRLSWEEFPDDRWPSDAWVVGAAVDPAAWPELWTFLAGGEEVRDV